MLRISKHTGDGPGLSPVEPPFDDDTADRAVLRTVDALHEARDLSDA